MSLITNLLQAAQSATRCSTAQYRVLQTFFNLFGGKYIQLGSLVLLIVAVLFQSGAQAASVGPRAHLDASNTLLTGHPKSPFMSQNAAESLLPSQHGNRLLFYQQKDLAVRVATLPIDDCYFVWIGASTLARPVTFAMTRRNSYPWRNATFQSLLLKRKKLYRQWDRWLQDWCLQSQWRPCQSNLAWCVVMFWRCGQHGWIFWAAVNCLKIAFR